MIRRLLLTVLGAAALLGAPAAADAQYVYVGRWALGDGPIWSSNPLSLNGVETAALLFGGDASNYAISTAGTDPNLINFSAWYDVFGGPVGIFAENLATGGPYYDLTYSAYVCDHAYAENASYCTPDDQHYNYAFAEQEVESAPEPASLVLIGTGLLGIVAVARRRRRVNS